MIDFTKLTAPFSPDDVHWRVGATTGDKSKGMALAYIDARAVMERLDAVCGPANWQCRYPHANGKTVCEIGIRLADETGEFPQLNPEWTWKADGAGDTDHEAEKGALSDAFKRAAVRWGIGRYLYDLPSPWVAIEQYGKSYKIKESEHPKLRALLIQEGGSSLHRGKETAGLASSADSPPPALTAWLTGAKLAIRDAREVNDLVQWRAKNEAALAKLKANWLGQYDALMAEYDRAKVELAEINTATAA